MELATKLAEDYGAQRRSSLIKTKNKIDKEREIMRSLPRECFANDTNSCLYFL